MWAIDDDTVQTRRAIKLPGTGGTSGHINHCVAAVLAISCFDLSNTCVNNRVAGGYDVDANSHRPADFRSYAEIVPFDGSIERLRRDFAWNVGIATVCHRHQRHLITPRR